MATLFDVLKNRMAEMPETDNGPDQAAVAGVLKARGGKAGGSTAAPAASNVQERSVQQQVAGAAAQQTLAGRVAAAGVGQKETALNQDFATGQAKLAQAKQLGQQKLVTENANAQSSILAATDTARMERKTNETLVKQRVNADSVNKIAEMTVNRGIALDDMFSNFEADTKELEFRKDTAELEQRAFLLAMSDRQYLDELSRIGRENALEDELAFKEEMTRLAMGDEVTRVLADLGFKSIMNMKKRDYEIQLQKMGAGIKIDLAQQMVRAESQRTMWTGIGDSAGTIASTAAKYYAPGGKNDGLEGVEASENTRNYDANYNEA